MYGLKNLWHSEPAAIAGAIRVTLTAAVLFGLNLNDAQLVAVVLVIETWLTLLTRSKVTPVNKDGGQ